MGAVTYKRIWPIICVGVLLLVQVVPFSGAVSNRIVKILLDLLHFPLGFFLTFFLYLLLPKFNNKAKRILIALLCVLVFSITVEFLQPYVGRDASWYDGWYTGLGALVFVCCVMGHLSMKRNAWMLSGLFLCVSALIPLSCLLIDEYRIKSSFPLLAGFEHVHELTRWSTNSCRLIRTKQHASQGEYAGQIVVDDNPGNYPGVFLDRLVADWEHSVAVSFDACWSGRKSVKLWIRLDDVVYMPPYSQRFQVMVVLTQGMNHIQIKRNEYEKTSGGRMMDLSKVTRFGLFFDEAAPSDTLYIDNVRLMEKDMP